MNRPLRTLFLALGLRAATSLPLMHGLPASAAEPAGQVLLQEDFGNTPAGGALPDGWWAEGSDAVAVQDGALIQNANPDNGATSADSVVWMGTEFQGDVRFDADVTVLSAKGNVNDVVVFFLFSDPSGKPLKGTREQRASGKQGLYTKALHGYVFFYWGKNGVTTPANIRFRDCPGAHLLVETDAHHVKAGQRYRLTIERKGTRLCLIVDGKKLAKHDLKPEQVGNPIHAKGLIGLKTWNTSLRWDNIRVSRVP